jgi:hypothetical protein
LRANIKRKYIRTQIPNIAKRIPQTQSKVSKKKKELKMSQMDDVLILGHGVV